MTIQQKLSKTLVTGLKKLKRFRMEEQKLRSVPVLPWMRSPVDFSLFEECPLDLLPFLDSRYLFFIPFSLVTQDFSYFYSAKTYFL